MVMLAAEMTRNQGRVDTANASAFFAQGYTNEHFVDLILQIGDTTAMNYLYNLTKVPIDFPIAPELVDIGD